MDYGLKYPWQEVVVEAFIAASADLGIKIKEAERTISARMSEPQIDSSERMALDDALRMLRVLMTETKAEEAEQSRSRTQMA
jgi:hypothetical protein